MRADHVFIYYAKFKKETENCILISRQITMRNYMCTVKTLVDFKYIPAYNDKHAYS